MVLAVPEDLAEALQGEQEVRISFEKPTGGRRTLPIWFAFEGRTLQLLPMYGLKTKWFIAVEKNGEMEVISGDVRRRSAPEIVKDRARVDRIKARFAEKYGPTDVSRYYPTSEVALEIQV